MAETTDPLTFAEGEVTLLESAPSTKEGLSKASLPRHSEEMFLHSSSPDSALTRSSDMTPSWSPADKAPSLECEERVWITSPRAWRRRYCFFEVPDEAWMSERSPGRYLGTFPQVIPPSASEAATLDSSSVDDRAELTAASTWLLIVLRSIVLPISPRQRKHRDRRRGSQEGFLPKASRTFATVVGMEEGSRVEREARH